MRLKPTKKQEITTNAIAFRLAKKKLKRFKRKLTGVSLVPVIFLLFSISAFAGDGDKPKNSNTSDIKEVKELTIKNLKQLLIEEGVQHHEIVLRQAILETGWFKCSSCSLNRNNIFGFYYKKKYITYENWQECVRYYKRWQDRHYKGGDYYIFLKQVGFATNPQYVNLLKSVKID